MFDVPVALLAYNRPAQTARVWEVIRQLQPRRLLLVADGPRDADDAHRCDDVRAILEAIDWTCDAEHNFASANLGCRRRVASGLDWVFRTVDRAVILEDDTLPDPSFFAFCRELLDRYEHDESVMQIAGANLAGSVRGGYSYGFSRHVLPPWGWATWSRAWSRYDVDLALSAEQEVSIRQHLGSASERWGSILTAYRRTMPSWDFQWNVALWLHRGWSLVPSRNLVSNIGWGPGATFTRWSASDFGNQPRQPCPFPLSHPPGPGTTFDDTLEPRLFELFDEVNRHAFGVAEPSLESGRATR